MAAVIRPLGDQQKTWSLDQLQHKGRRGGRQGSAISVGRLQMRTSRHGAESWALSKMGRRMPVV